MSNRRALSNAVKESKQPKKLSRPKDMILDPMGQWNHPGENTRIPSNNITMQGVNYPVWAVPNVGQPMMMQPGANYNFPEADYVDEYPEFAEGGTPGDPGDGWKELYLEELNEKLAKGTITQKQYNYLKAKIDEYYNIEDQIGGLRKQLVSKQLPEDKFTEQYQALRKDYKQKYNENHGCNPEIENCPSDEELDKLYPTETKEKILVGNNEVTKYNDQGEIVKTVEPIYDYVEKKPEKILTEEVAKTESTVPKSDEPQLNLKKDKLPTLHHYGPSSDGKNIRLKKGTRPIARWAPYSAALRAFTGYEKGDSQKLWDEIKAANAEERPVNLKGIPLMGKSDLKQRRNYKQALKDYEKNLPATELENERRRQVYEEQLRELKEQKPEEPLETDKYGGASSEYRRGGALKSKKFSRSLQATNKFFREHSFFEKPKKLSKKRIYDPNAKYFKDGGSAGDYIELDIPKNQIQKFIDGGYIVEEISVPELNDYAMGGEPCQPCPDGTVPERTENGDCPCTDNVENLNFYKFALQERDAIMNQPAMWNEDPDMMNPDGSYKFCVDCLLKDYNDPDVVKSVAALINNGVANFPKYDMPDLLKGLEKYQIPMPVYQSNLKETKKEIMQPGQWAGVTPELVQPGEEAFPLPQNKRGGQFELGDEIDEATMKQLKKLGYTFQKI